MKRLDLRHMPPNPLVPKSISRKRQVPDCPMMPFIQLGGAFVPTSGHRSRYLYADINLRSPIYSYADRRKYYLDVMSRGWTVAVEPDQIVVEGDLAFVRGRLQVKKSADTAPTA